VSAPGVRGGGAITALCLRCLAVLAVVNATALVVALLVSGNGASDDVPSGFYLLFVALVVACVPVGVVGIPAGLLLANLLQSSSREWVHVAAFAVVGAVLSVTLCAMVNLLAASPWFVLVAAAEGAIGAGVARWWTGRVHLRREPWSDAQGAALPWGRIAP
jgi:hypothetical protein